MNSIINRGPFNSQFSGPLGARHFFTIVFDPMVHSHIVLLRDPCSPAAVAWLIISVIIAAINAMRFWRIAHIGIEILKLQPPLANPYSSGSVFVIFSALGISTSLFHRTPNPIDFGVRQPMAESPFLATTASRMPRSEMESAHALCLAAIATAFPIKNRIARGTCVPAIKAEHDQMSEFFPGQVYKSFVSWFTLALSHVASIPGDLVRAVSGCNTAGGSFILAESNA
ncbi:MAG TPA: hypothetical protein VEW05_31430 [Candidatus Polarisedimenticolia bacterium]|nr:hypothetical protein [Candidatus Polarisedimenticolia bacterium]